MTVISHRVCISAASRLKKSTALPLLAVAAALCIPGGALAQTKIEQMIVTAQKRSQDIQTVPASISAFSGDALEDRQVSDFIGLQTATPNITIVTGGGSPIPVMGIRGISSDDTSMNADQTVALHVDGVYRPHPMSLWLAMMDLEAVEVLRGPQGTLYGRNANAGVINLVTKKPSNVFEGSATVFGGSWGRYGAKGYVSGPLADGVSARLSAMVDRSDGYSKNLTTGNDQDGHNMYGARLAVRLQPVETVTVDLSAEHTYDHSSPTSGLVTGVSPATSGPNYNALTAQGLDTRYTRDPWRIYSTQDGEMRIKTNSVSGTINWEITPDISLKSITAWQSLSVLANFDVDAMPVPFINVIQQGFWTTFSQEFNLSAKLWDRLDVVLGAYYLDDVAHDAGANIIFPIGLGANPATEGYNSKTIFNRYTAKSKAVFFDTTLNITDDFRLLGGIRRTVDHKYTLAGVNGTLPTTIPPAVLAGCPNNSRLRDLGSAAWTGKFGAQYDFTPDIMGYVQWQNGFRAGGYNANTCGSLVNGQWTGDDYLPEKIKSWEVGVKSTLFNSSTTLNVSLFHYKYSNMQVFRVVPGVSNASNAIDNAAKATLKGGEIELNSYLTDDFKVDLGVGYVDGKFGGGYSAVNGLLIPPTGVNVKGNQIPRAPKLSLNLGLEYTTRLGDLGELKARGEYSYTSRVFFTIFNEAFAHQDGYSLFNAIFTFTPEACPDLSFQVFGRNLADKAWIQGAFASPTVYNARGPWGPRRTFGAEVTAKF